MDEELKFRTGQSLRDLACIIKRAYNKRQNNITIALEQCQIAELVKWNEFYVGPDGKPVGFDESGFPLDWHDVIKKVILEEGLPEGNVLTKFNPDYKSSEAFSAYLIYEITSHRER